MTEALSVERILRFMDCFRNEVPAKQMRPNLIAECETCIANGYVSFDGSTYRTTLLGRQKLAGIPVLPLIDLVAMKEYERWNGLDGSLDFQSQHDIAAAWAAQRDFTFDKRTWTEVES